MTDASFIFEKVDEVLLIRVVLACEDEVGDELALVELPLLCRSVLQVHVGVQGVLDSKDDVEDSLFVSELLDHLCA